MEKGGIKSVTLRRSDISGMGLGLGFSIMGGAGYEFPPVIFGIENDSPAARSGQLEAGDIILSINEREVVKLSTKEVLKCLRLSGDIVHIKFKRDPSVVNRVRQFLSTPNYLEANLTTELNHQHHLALSPTKQNSKINRQNNNSSNNSSNNRSPHHHHQNNSSPKKAQNHQNNNQNQIGASGDNSVSNPPPPNHISFSDDLFINHSHQAFSNNKISPTNPFEDNNGGSKNGKKNFETFVMTGQAILNLSSTDSQDPYKTSSPGKTYSKLTPLPTAEVYTTLLDKSSPEENSMSLPLPPPPSDLTSISIKSEMSTKSDQQLPPPPHIPYYNEDGELILIQKSNNNGMQENGHLSDPPSNNSSTNGVIGNNHHNGQNNNEDTSISSSVMSDDLEEDDNVEDLQDEINNKHFKNGGINGGEEFKKSPKRGKDKERYNEYILLNGPIPEEEDSSNNTSSRSHSQRLAQQHHRDRESDEFNGSEDLEEDLEDSSEMAGAFGGGGGGRGSGGDSDSSDVESMRIAPVIKAVDHPSAIRLSKRLFSLDGFKVSDVWRQLSKTNDFSRAVATEYLKFFDFHNQQLDISLRKFLSVCPLRGETTDRERVLSYFSTRYIECNPGIYASQDAVHTLTCALMLLNTDLYSGVKNGRKMTCSEFIENLSGLNDGDNFPKDILKDLYTSIRSQPLVSPQDPDDNSEESNKEIPLESPLAVPCTSNNIEYKRGYLIRKSIFEAYGKKTPFGKRSWRMYFCRLRELILALSHDENSKSTFSNAHTIKLHHAQAAAASDYHKRPHVFRILLADHSQYLFQSSDTREMNSWIDMINWNAARFSAPALDAPCSSSKKFQKPCLPSSLSRLSSREQLAHHQTTIEKYQQDLNDLILPDGKPTVLAKKQHNKKDLREKVTFFQFEIRRYRCYVDILERRSEENENDVVELQILPNPPTVLIGINENN